jgi:trehalose-phosphatase
MAGRSVALFLDLDGTLAPVEARPDLVELPASTRGIVEELARRCPVAIVSGRGLDDLRDIVAVRSLYYVADHGFQILGPLRSGVRLEIGAEYRQQLEQAASQLRRALQSIEGALLEQKGLSLSVHYRLVPEARHSAVLRAVADVAESFPALRVTEGKLVYELRPPGDWDKGKALVWLMEHLAQGRPSGGAAGDAPAAHADGAGSTPGDDRAVGAGPGATDRAAESSGTCPVALGDDLTDEDMFAAVQGWGIAVLVGDAGRPTLAGYRLSDHLEAAHFLEKLLAFLPEAAVGAPRPTALDLTFPAGSSPGVPHD